METVPLNAGQYPGSAGQVGGWHRCRISISEDAPDSAQDIPSCPCGLQAHAGILVGMTEPQSSDSGISLCPALPCLPPGDSSPIKGLTDHLPLLGELRAGDHGYCQCPGVGKDVGRWAGGWAVVWAERVRQAGPTVWDLIFGTKMHNSCLPSYVVVGKGVT